MATKRKRNPIDVAHYKTPEWLRLRAFVLARDRRVCWVCGGLASTVDHITPRSKGGSDHPTNLAAACAHCNYTRHNKYGDDPVHTTHW